MFDEIKTRFQNFKNDPNFVKKVIFIVVSTILFIALILFLIYINTTETKPSVPTTNNSASSSSSQSSRKTIDTLVFQSAINLKPVITNQIGNAQIFSPSYYFDPQSKFAINGNTVSNSPIFLPSSVYPDPNNARQYIINEYSGTTIYNGSTFVPINSKEIFSVTPSQNRYLYLLKTTSSLSLRSAGDAYLMGSPSTISNIPTTKDLNSSFTEILNFGDKIYVLVWENQIREDGVEIWQINSSIPSQVPSQNNSQNNQNSVSSSIPNSSPAILNFGNSSQSVSPNSGSQNSNPQNTQNPQSDTSGDVGITFSNNITTLCGQNNSLCSPVFKQEYSTLNKVSTVVKNSYRQIRQQPEYKLASLFKQNGTIFSPNTNSNTNSKINLSKDGNNLKIENLQAQISNPQNLNPQNLNPQNSNSQSPNSQSISQALNQIQNQPSQSNQNPASQSAIKIADLSNIKSINYVFAQENPEAFGIIFTEQILIDKNKSPEKNSYYQTSFWNPQTQTTESLLDMDKKTADKNLLGNIWASRCTILVKKMFCAIKEESVPVSALDSPDKIVSYDLETKTLEIPYNFSLSVTRMKNFGGKLYLLGSLTKNLYVLE